jgi:alpha-tubulin suppressor-like RCC1 family protein
LYSFGSNEFGQLGINNANTKSASIPELVKGSFIFMIVYNNNVMLVDVDTDDGDDRMCQNVDCIDIL